VASGNILVEFDTSFTSPDMGNWERNDPIQSHLCDMQTDLVANLSKSKAPSTKMDPTKFTLDMKSVKYLKHPPPWLEASKC